MSQLFSITNLGVNLQKMLKTGARHVLLACLPRGDTVQSRLNVGCTVWPNLQGLSVVCEVMGGSISIHDGEMI